MNGLLPPTSLRPLVQVPPSSLGERMNRTFKLFKRFEAKVFRWVFSQITAPSWERAAPGKR